jgi:hypothetical protein
LKKGGIYVIGNSLIGEFKTIHPKINNNQKVLENFILFEKYKAFSRIIYSNNVINGIENLILSSGIIFNL